MTERANAWRDPVVAFLEGIADPHLRPTAEMLYPGVLPASPPPTTPLSHYPTFAGRKGILEAGRLWATEAHYLNDATERDFGDQMIEALLARQEASMLAPVFLESWRPRARC